MVTPQFTIKTPITILWNRVINYIGNLFFALSVIISLALILFSSVTIECVVVGESMVPTYNADKHSPQDIVYVNKYMTEYSRGDIVVVDTGEKDPIIKRVVGVAGDVIDVINHPVAGYKVEINGKIIEEDYINYKVYDDQGNALPLDQQNGLYETYNNFHYNLKLLFPELFVDDKLVVPEGHVFVLGDNRHNSRDSTSYGTFKKSQLLGCVEQSCNGDEGKLLFYINYILEGKFFDTLFNCF